MDNKVDFLHEHFPIILTSPTFIDCVLQQLHVTRNTANAVEMQSPDVPFETAFKTLRFNVKYLSALSNFVSDGVVNGGQARAHYARVLKVCIIFDL